MAIHLSIHNLVYVATLSPFMVLTVRQAIVGQLADQQIIRAPLDKLVTQMPDGIEHC